jgi:hypothetical protein
MVMLCAVMIMVRLLQAMDKYILALTCFRIIRSNSVGPRRPPLSHNDPLAVMIAKSESDRWIRGFKSCSRLWSDESLKVLNY